ncbi:hypothetical protein GGI15_003370 [Coemansia interrupta]|uniref:Uncharacterized protein n=1 Tax=Coemansia interrupta TaxID=1126814 RepID=A0A9W8H7S7_9FUNG|nr:hypothetical protein GGI15_003370 [Coemansia interrupta]
MTRRVAGRAPSSTITDLTLFSACGIRARVDDLQPENDPFILDNIFKSPKRRRRGLLSWSAMPPLDMLPPLPPSLDRHPAGGPIRDLHRQLSSRSTRRSILSSKCSFTSIRRRHKRISTGRVAAGTRQRPPSVALGEHTRSISDPTSAIIALSPAPTIASTISELSVSSMSRDSMDTECSDSMAVQTWPAAKRPASKPPIRPQAFAEPPPNVSPHAHPAASQRPDAFTYVSLFEHTKERPSLRRVSEHADKAPWPTHPSEIRRPPPVHVPKFDSRLRSQRCSSMPCTSFSATTLYSQQPRSAADVTFGMPSKEKQWRRRPEIPECLLRAPPFEVATGGFCGVKNSLDVQYTAPLSLARPATRAATAPSTALPVPPAVQSSCQLVPFPRPADNSVSMDDAALREADSGVRLLPAAVRLLRMFAVCGSSGN